MRIAGVEIKDSKRIEIGLTNIYGIGLSRSRKIMKEFNFPINLKIGELTAEQIKSVEKHVADEYIITDELKRSLVMNFKKLIKIGCYRGIRGIKGLPRNGQRTHSNSKTSRKISKWGDK